MGSLRNPIGPLPSSIYWRRRAVVLSLVALLILLVLWAANALSGGGGSDGDRTEGQGRQDKGPASSITPGPTDDESATNSRRPGGRDEVDDDETGGDGADGGTGSDPGGAGDSSTGSGTSGSGDSGGGESSGGQNIPAGSDLRVCRPGDISLALRSARNEYEPGIDPTIELTVSNTTGSACKVDFGPSAAVITITDVSGTVVWASDHCPADPGAVATEVPSGGKATHTVTWKRVRSAAKCATPPAGAVEAGTYLVEAKLGGGPTKQTSFVLARS